MGIQLDEFDKHMLKFLADGKRRGESPFPYLFGALASAVDLFVRGTNEKRDLESLWASIKLVEQLWKKHSPDELDEIRCGTREIPCEDVPSGQ
jgi:hypothetical protein